MDSQLLTASAPPQILSEEQRIQEAILRTLSYSDLFDFPLNLYEIHRYLDVSASVEQVTNQINFLGFIQQVSITRGLVTLPGREHLVQVRDQRMRTAQSLWKSANYYGGLIGRIPFVKMVAVTGSLATGNCPPDADIDFLIVTEPGRLWSARAAIIAIVKLAARRGIELCPNYLLSENALSLDNHSFYTARELTQMVPIVGYATYSQIRQKNRWLTAHLPNADGLPPGSEMFRPQKKRPYSQRLAELFLRGRLFNPFERWEMERKIKKLRTQTGPRSETFFSADVCKGHFDAYHEPTLQAYTDRADSIPPLPASAASARSKPDPSKPKLLFGQSYYLRFDPKLYSAMQPYPPLGSMIAAAWMRQQGYAVDLFDAMLADSEDEWAAALDRTRPQYAILYEDNFNYLSKMCLLNMREAAFSMIQMAKARGCTVIIAGSDATDHASRYLSAGADFVIRGEGEETLSELLDFLESRPGEQPAKIAGLTYGPPETPFMTPARPVMKSVDHLPAPAWELIDVKRYRSIWLKHHGYFSMNVVTTRGCPYHCNWCAKPIWGQRYTSRDPIAVADEIAWLYDTHRPDHIWFADDIMGLKPGWWAKFADRLEAHQVNIPFKCLSRADLLVRHNAEIDALARAGCDIVWIGAESGSQKVLDAMEKGTTVEQIYDAAERLHAAGIKIAFFLQFGYPGETWEDVQKTIQMVRDCRPDDIGISVSYPLPGTRFYDNVRQQLGTKQNWTDSADLDMLYAGPFTTAFYRQLHTVIHKEFRSRKGFAALKMVASTPAKWRPSHLREAAAIVYRLSTLPIARWKLQRLRHAPVEHKIQPVAHMRLEDAAMPSPQES